MPFSTNINTYSDVVSVLTAARKAGGAIYELASPAKARNWSARAYYYRKLLVKAAQARAGKVPGFVPSTEWDDIELEVVGNSVRIRFQEIKGILKSVTGAQLEVPFIKGDRGASETLIKPPTEESVISSRGDGLADDLGLTSAASDLASRLGIKKK